MNWITSIKYVIGVFWTALFQDQEFLRGMIHSLALFGKMQEAAQSNWEVGLIAGNKSVYQDSFPVSVYIDIESVRLPYASFSDILDIGSTKAIEEPCEGLGWLANSLYPISDTYCLTDHVIDYSKVLLPDFDYKYSNGQFLFYEDPATLNLPMLKLVDDSGDLRIYYVLFGWHKKERTHKDVVSGLLGLDLDDVTADAWTVQQCGTTYYNAKQLFGAVSGARICKEDGDVNDVWEEQGYTCMKVGNRVYSAPNTASINYMRGDSVVKGDILLGDMKFFSGKDSPSSDDVPAMRVRTDVGELLAVNVDGLPSYTDQEYPGLNILQLRGKPEVVSKYVEHCRILSLDTKCPYIDIPDSTNPFKFVTQDIRRGRGCFVSLTAKRRQEVVPDLAVLRNNMCASGILSVFVKAEGDVSGVTISGFTADVGNAAVSVDATITIKEASAKIEVFR